MEKFKKKIQERHSKQFFGIATRNALQKLTEERREHLQQEFLVFIINY